MRSKTDAIIPSAPEYEIKPKRDEPWTDPRQSKWLCLGAFRLGKSHIFASSLFFLTTSSWFRLFLNFSSSSQKEVVWTEPWNQDWTNTFFCILSFNCYVHIGNTQYYKYSRSGLVFLANFLPGLGNHLCFVVLVTFMRYSRWNWGLVCNSSLTSSCMLSFKTWFTSHDLVGRGRLCS